MLAARFTNAIHKFTIKVSVCCYGYGCVYNSCRAACSVDGQRLTGDTQTAASSAVRNSVVLCYWYRRRSLLQNTHTPQLFVCGLANFNCIMYSKTSDKPTTAAAGNGLKWPWKVDGGACDLILERARRCLQPRLLTAPLSLPASQYLFCLLFIFLNVSSHFLPKAPDWYRSTHGLAYKERASRVSQRNRKEPFVSFSSWSVKNVCVAVQQLESDLLDFRSTVIYQCVSVH